MSTNTIAVIYASGEPPVPPDLIPSDQLLGDEDEQRPLPEDGSALASLPETDAQPAAAESLPPEGTDLPSANPDLWLYRDRTVALLRRYMRLSIEVGRMPALLGREIFRSRVTSYKASTFEDSVIFVHDIERSLEQLDDFDQQLIAKIVLQEYSHEEAGRLLGCGRRHIVRCYPEALDRVTELFLERELLARLPATSTAPEKSCQGGLSDDFSVSDDKQTKNIGNNILD